MKQNIPCLGVNFCAEITPFIALWSLSAKGLYKAYIAAPDKPASTRLK